MMLPKLPSLVLCVVTVLVASSAVQASPTYLTSMSETLFRATDTGSGYNIETFQFDTTLRGMHRDPVTGEIYVTADIGGASPSATIYTLQNAVSGTPALVPYAQLTGRYGCLTKIGDYFYGFDSGDLYLIDLTDPANPAEEYVGNTGLVQTGGTAYDPATGTLYMLSYNTDALYTVDTQTAAATYVGDLGINPVDLGAEWFGDSLYGAVQRYSQGTFEIGQIDTGTGHFTTMFTVANYITGGGTGLTIVPEPAALILGLLACAAFGRRR